MSIPCIPINFRIKLDKIYGGVRLYVATSQHIARHLIRCMLFKQLFSWTIQEIERVKTKNATRV